MKKNKKLVIVGTGITGFSAALLALKNNVEVEFFETKSNEGGILKDTSFKRQKYITGCQYLMKKSLWYKHVPTNIKKNFREVKIKYMTYCDLFNNNIKILTNYPDLFIDKKIKVKNNFIKFNTLLSRCSSYPSEIFHPLLEWVRRFKVDPNQLMPDSNRNGLMFSRVYPKENKDMLNLKKKNKFIDDLYGLPKNNSINGLFPLNGYDKFFSQLKNYLKKKNVKFNFNTPVQPKWNKNKLSLLSKGNLIEPDYVLWTGNPVPLIKKYNSQFLDSVNFKIRIINFEVVGKLIDDFYIQVFSKNTSILRIFLYKKNKGSFCSLECFDENETMEDICVNANKIIKSTKKDIYLKNNVKSEVIQKRYSLLTLKDFKILKEFKTKTKKSNLIPSPWEHYSSTKKLSILENTLKNIL